MFIFALTITGARWSNQITAHPITGLSVNGNVGHQLDLVLDLGDYVIIHLVYEGLSVNDNVGRFLDHVLDQGDHVIINLIHEGNIVNGYVTITLDTETSMNKVHDDMNSLVNYMIWGECNITIDTETFIN